TNNVNEGYETTVVGSLNKAYGMGNFKYASDATIVGTGNTIMSLSGVMALGSGNIVHEGIAIGAKNKAMGENAVALGNQSSAMYTDTVGIGFGAHGDADAVIAIGRAAKGDALGGVAIGRYAEVHASTGVALGESSVSSRGAGVVGYMPGAVGQTAEEVAAYLGKAEEYKSWKEDREANQEAYEKVRAWSAAVEAERQAHNEINKARIAYAENSTEENKKAITEKQEAYKKASDKRQETDVAARPYYKTIEDLNSRYGQIFGKLMSTGGAVSVGNEKEGITRQIVNVAAGTKDTDAVNVYQLRDAVENFKQETRVAEDGKYVKKDKTAGENLTALDKEIDKLGTDSAVAEDGAYVKKDKKVGENLTALDKGIDKLVTDSAVAEDGAYVKKDKKVGENLTALDKQVQANAGEIGALANGMGALDSRVNKVGAGAAALAALHPLDFDPEDKWDFAAGYGHYKGANAVAIGAFYRPDENKMVSVGGSFGGGENMINVGVSFKVGEGDSPYAGVSKAQLAQRIKQQDEELAAQKAQIREILEQLAAMKKA
ncbi:MAG: YadA-like family protein, partial [Negativicoccus succinicivorans]|uniref:YadA-like family protein n=1 Tax=Negativicoccus succinicivorans TaxID=620903 RepID=UPI00290C2CD5